MNYSIILKNTRLGNWKFKCNLKLLFYFFIFIYFKSENKQIRAEYDLRCFYTLYLLLKDGHKVSSNFIFLL